MVGEKKMNNNPMISVVMPVYNAEKYLGEAIQSILNQTYTDFEFIIINDGSTDKSLEIIEKYKKQDERILLISRENRGLVASLNEGIEKAKGKYIARMDADDISLPERFKKQLALMEEENLDLCGCSFIIINKSNHYMSTRIVSSNVNFNTIILARSVPFAHGTAMIRKEFMFINKLQYGQTKYIKAEDYALWIQFEEYNAKISNVNEFLFKYRDIENSLSKQNLNYIHAMKLSHDYIKENSHKLQIAFNEYKNKLYSLNDFEKEQLSYFLIKTVFINNSLEKIQFLKKIPIAINIINLIRIFFGK